MDESIIPTFDYERIASLDEAEREKELQKYAADITAAKAAMANSRASEAGLCAELATARYSAAKYKLCTQKEFTGFCEREAEIEKILADMPALSSLDCEERLKTAYYIDRGMRGDSLKSTEELVKAVMGNAEAMRLIETKIAADLKANTAPAMFATAGNASFSLTPKEKPKNIDEATRLARDIFGVN